eukprot:679416_1
MDHVLRLYRVIRHKLQWRRYSIIMRLIVLYLRSIYPENRTAWNIFGLLEYPLKFACHDADKVDVNLQDALFRGVIHARHFSIAYFAIGTHESKFMNQLFRVWTPSRKVEKDEDNMFELDGCEVQEGDKFVIELD